jgi:hypothetical protein
MALDTEPALRCRSAPAGQLYIKGGDTCFYLEYKFLMPNL